MENFADDLAVPPFAYGDLAIVPHTPVAMREVEPPVRKGDVLADTGRKQFSAAELRDRIEEFLLPGAIGVLASGRLGVILLHYDIFGIVRFVCFERAAFEDGLVELLIELGDGLCFFIHFEDGSFLSSRGVREAQAIAGRDAVLPNSRGLSA